MTPADDLAPTWYIDHDAETVRAFTARATANATSTRAAVAGIFAAVRDGVRYDPYRFALEPEGYRASAIASQSSAFCVPKAVLMVAACRAAGIPARIGFADVRNHLQSERLLELMGTDLFRYHGYAAVQVHGRWLKASPAFNSELCARFGVAPLDFDGTQDALLHAFTGDGRRHMEYVEDHGTFDDLPYEQMLTVYRETYPGLDQDMLRAVDDRAFTPGEPRT